ncbi:pullulanase [candidate division KSB1 bacterium]|nr:pullulanase [candidate division KSB1 bacterium]
MIIFCKTFQSQTIIGFLLMTLFFLSNLYGQSRYPDYFPEQNKYYSTKQLGANIESGKTMFRLFAPNAEKVSLVIFKKHNENQGKEYPMKKDKDGVWEYQLDGEQYGLYYAYRVTGAKDEKNMSDPSLLIADPYSKAVVTKNNYLHPGKSIVTNTNYDWEGDTWVTKPIQDLIIYEMHVRDMTVHPTSGVKNGGTYLGLTEEGKVGGIDYLLDLGINAVELLPCHDFGNIEIPYKDSTLAINNDWNPYERNHWGYMPSYFFAPESYYASEGNIEPDNYCGINGQQINEFKNMVKALHKKGIAVIMDVVYNHCSQYDLNPFKYIDKKYYFRLEKNGDFMAKSWCGNDFRTERPMARRMILESVKYWMTEYHIDGFRFDLAYLMDEETCREILSEAKKINPNAYIIAEPWGDGYAPAYFSKLGWAAWNDKIRNGVKGQNPFDNLGFVFGKWERENTSENLKRYVLGSTTIDGGLFQKIEHSINYLESHDDHTFGDFVRIGSKAVKETDKIKDIAANVKLTPEQLKTSKLGALYLFISQGAVMIHSGQEFARSKVIAKTEVSDSHQGQIDHNSYNKDNETNWINYEHKEINAELYNYYKGLIALRKKYSVLRKAPRESFELLANKNEFGVGFWINKKLSGAKNDIVVLMNGDPKKSIKFKLPQGEWSAIVNGEKAGTEIIQKNIQGEIEIGQTSGLVLVK